MNTANTTAHRSLASLKLPGPVPALITYAIGIVRAMTGNPSFPTPMPSLAVVQAAIDALTAAEATALARTRGSAAARNERRTALVSILELLRAHVQATADASPENGPSIIESAGIALRKMPIMPPRVFEASLGVVSGSIKLVAPAAARRASYDWEISTDGGKTWVALDSTLQSKTTVSGLQPATYPQFRYRALTKAGKGDWSQTVSILVR